MTTDATTVATPSPAQIAGRRFGLLLQTNLLLYLRNRMAVFWNMVFPIGLMLLFGEIVAPGGVTLTSARYPASWSFNPLTSDTSPPSSPRLRREGLPPIGGGTASDRETHPASRAPRGARPRPRRGR